jgi:hypothetical protein
MTGIKHPVRPDGRYVVVKGKLWRFSDPEVDSHERVRLIKKLMDARRAVKDAKTRQSTGGGERGLGHRGQSPVCGLRRGQIQTNSYACGIPIDLMSRTRAGSVTRFSSLSYEVKGCPFAFGGS